MASNSAWKSSCATLLRCLWAPHPIHTRSVQCEVEVAAGTAGSATPGGPNSIIYCTAEILIPLIHWEKAVRYPKTQVDTPAKTAVWIQQGNGYSTPRFERRYIIGGVKSVTVNMIFGTVWRQRYVQESHSICNSHCKFYCHLHNCKKDNACTSTSRRPHYSFAENGRNHARYAATQRSHMNVWSEWRHTLSLFSRSRGIQSQGISGMTLLICSLEVL